MPQAELSAGTMEYDDTGGTGPVVVLVHGLLMDGTQWRHVVADLRRNYRCILPTLPMGAHRRPMRPDELRVRADQIKVGDSFIKPTGEQVGVGKRNKEEMVTYGILFGRSGLLAKSNKKSVILEGTPATAYVQEGIALPILNTSPNESL